MKLDIRIIQLLLLTFTVTQTKQASEQTPKMRNVCFYTDWSVYRVGKWSFTPQNIDPNLCSHLIYSMADINEDEADIISADPYQDIEKHGFKDVVDIRNNRNKDLKCMLAVGGYRAGSTKFSAVAVSEEKRDKFAKNALKFLKTYDFDGLFIDWAYPNDLARNGLPEDITNFPKLLHGVDKVFKTEAAASGKPKKLLAISIPGDTLIVERGYDLKNLEKYVDFLAVLGYDYHFAYDPEVGHHSALYPLPEEMAGSQHENEGLNADSSINFVLSKGVDPKKVVLGVPLYGRTFTLQNPNKNKLGAQATGQGVAGKATREDGYVAYFEICSNINDGWKVEHPNKTAMGPYAFKRNQWVGYEDADSVRMKGAYAKKRGLGGLSFWSMDQDDFLGSCGSTAFPLIKAGKEGYLNGK